MISLAVEFCGLNLRNPIVAASAPPTETLENIIKCADAGVGAVITKTSAGYEASQYLLGGRRTYFDKYGMWTQGTFRHETLTIEDGVKLVSQAVKNVDIPIIASVGSLTLDPEKYLASCIAMQEAGASMIQLDLFYIPQPRCAPENMARLIEILNLLTSRLTIPIAPKLNQDIPAHYAAQILKNTNIAALSLIDSVRLPVPINVHDNGKSLIPFLVGSRECSLFGRWQKPLTLQYTSVMYHELGLPICAGGGFERGLDAAEAIMLGATTVQFATLIIKYGYGQIKKVIKQLTHFMEQRGYNTIAQMRGQAHQHIRWDGFEIFEPAKAVVNQGLCIDCGRCTNVVFCQDIHLDMSGKVKIEDSCDGCGLCPTVCPVPGALQVIPLPSPKA